MTRLIRLSSVAFLLIAVGCGRTPKVVSATPTTICANEDSTITITGSDLSSSAKVQIGSADTDMGTVPLVAAAMVSGSGSSLMAKFTANSLTPSDKPLDLVYTDSGKRIVLPGVITVVPGISIAAVDPATVYNGVDFPTSVYGTGMGAVKMIQIATAGGAAVNLTGVNAVDNNRADAVVPMGTPPGVYDITVVDQNGCTATLAGALTITADLTVSVC
ncbi:MAG TPA: IPT/TIG domain-containing protein, partial [Polyangia bacterium]|nr:IPT/TIG domain-containing protein [Polyangia bacterium]